MITDATKAKAIAAILRQVPHEDIAEELEIPVVLVREWANLQGKNLVTMEANLLAADRVLKGEVLEANQVDILKQKLEQAAIDVTNEVPAAIGDPMYAKSLQLCADTITKLYQVIVCRGDVNPNNMPLSGNGISAFQSIMRD